MYAIESRRGIHHGFYGLLSAGWEITDLAKPWSRGPIPNEAMVVQLIVSFFDVERRQGDR